jgi:hypothetical protein
MASPHKICETSLRWILALRSRKSLHKFDRRKIDGLSHPEAFGDYAGDFGHSGASFGWSLRQAKRIESIGLEKWLKSEDARGFSHVFNNNLKDFLR